MNAWGPSTRGLRLLASVLSCAGIVQAQELEPRAYRALPTGLNFLVGAYQYSSGNVVFDGTAPLEDLDIDIHTASLSYLRTFGLAGRSASVSFTAPRVQAAGSAEVAGARVSRSRSGWADARLRLAVNLAGGPALSMQEFAKRRPGRTIGVGLTISVPTGQYDPQYAVNFGANRWGFKSELGYSSVRRRWILDSAVGVWLFTNNDDGPGGTTVRQDPIWSWQGHISYGFANGMWLAFDLNYFYGGATAADGRETGATQSNSRAGLTWSIPIATRHSLKLGGSTGSYTRAGADFDLATVAYQYQWGR
ncbi:MAG TPA: transporter [Candidatus Polarisedimenticolaceae bacterium]|nr:transporter [Candidatus Polarisedimenticolaceae bacterium]